MRTNSLKSSIVDFCSMMCKPDQSECHLCAILSIKQLANSSWMIYIKEFFWLHVYFRNSVTFNSGMCEVIK